MRLTLLVIKHGWRIPGAEVAGTVIKLTAGVFFIVTIDYPRDNGYSGG